MGRFVQGALAAVAALGFVLATPGIADAHVTVQPPEAAAGSRAKLVFRVPNESDTASTISLEVNFPEDYPFPTVRTQPVPGWTATTEMRTLETPIPDEDGDITEAVAKITWTGGAIAPGEFQEFPISLGPLPEDAESLSFPTLQTYDDGEVSRWINPPEPGGEEPEDPAPTLTLTPAVEGGDDHGGGSDSTDTTMAEDMDDASGDAAEAQESDTEDSDDDSSSDTLAIIALVVGALGLIVGGIALARAGKSSSKTA